MQELADEIEATTANYALELQQFEQLKVYIYEISMPTCFTYVAFYKRAHQVRFEAQETNYLAAMQEKKLEEQKELERKIDLFRTRFAAAKIQHFWRHYQIRKLEYMKSKKGKKGRKKAGKK